MGQLVGALGLNNGRIIRKLGDDAAGFRQAVIVVENGETRTSNRTLILLFEYKNSHTLSKNLLNRCYNVHIVSLLCAGHLISIHHGGSKQG